MRKVYVDVKVRLIINMDEGTELYTIINEMDYIFRDTTTKADVEDSEIVDYEVTDSK